MHVGFFNIYVLKEGIPRGEATLLILVKIIYISFNDTCKARVFFNDFRQAFNLVENDTLLIKLKLHEPVLGVRGSTFNWFTMYLGNREQKI